MLIALGPPPEITRDRKSGDPQARLFRHPIPASDSGGFFLAHPRRIARTALVLSASHQQDRHGPIRCWFFAGSTGRPRDIAIPAARPPRRGIAISPEVYTLGSTIPERSPMTKLGREPEG